MFIGHHAAAFAAKTVAPRAGLGTLFVATMWLDLIWPVLVLLGFERFEISPGATAVTPLRFVFYPWSHSLIMALLWGAVLGGLFYVLTQRGREALVVAALVVSHWLLDFVVHDADLPLLPDGAKYGLGLWDDVTATLLVELALLIAGVALYLRETQPRNATGRWSFVALVVVLLAIYGANAFGPAPESVEVVAYSALALWIFVPWAWWIDRNRIAVQRRSTRPIILKAR